MKFFDFVKLSPAVEPRIGNDYFLKCQRVQDFFEGAKTRGGLLLSYSQGTLGLSF